MFRNTVIAVFAVVLTAGTFGGTTSILSAQFTAPVSQIA